jgi:FtsP/CotA-like multicopper oxidase with cupredoxin domain
MQLRVVPATAVDASTPPRFLRLPAIAPIPDAIRTRPLALMEMTGTGFDPDGAIVEGPVAAMLGSVVDGSPEMKGWMDPITENPAVGDTEVWEFHNTTADAHPMHVHEVTFEVVDRQGLAVDGDDLVTPFALVGDPVPPEPWERGRKDTVIAYPGQVTRVKATFANAGRFVWHCHIVEHEDNEMMRPFRVGEPEEGEPGSI